MATEWLVAACTRQAAAEGIPITLLRRGDPVSGALVLKVNRLDGTAHLWIEAQEDGTRVWLCPTATPSVSDRAADIWLARQEEIDPDAWLIEIEDKQGRLWFPGHVVIG